jgi:hypothetical protein
MRYDYVVTLKRENARKTDLVSFLLLLFSLIAFCIVQIRDRPSGFLSIASGILIIGLLYHVYVFRKGRELRFRNWLFATGIFWLGMPYFQWMLFPFVIFSVLESQAKYPLEIGFNDQGVLINTLFKKKTPWNALHSVMLKDGLLTLDFKNNTLIQKEVLDDDEPDASEDEFNDYCRDKIINLP